MSGAKLFTTTVLYQVSNGSWAVQPGRTHIEWDDRESAVPDREAVADALAETQANKGSTYMLLVHRDRGLDYMFGPYTVENVYDAKRVVLADLA